MCYQCAINILLCIPVRVTCSSYGHAQKRRLSPVCTPHQAQASPLQDQFTAAEAMSGALKPVLDVAKLRDSITAARDGSRGAVADLLKAAHASGIHTPPFVTLILGSETAEVLTSDLLLSTTPGAFTRTRWLPAPRLSCQNPLSIMRHQRVAKKRLILGARCKSFSASWRARAATAQLTPSWRRFPR